MEKLVSVAPSKVDDSNEADSDDLTIHCATCSQPVMLKKAMVHFERCFSKVRVCTHTRCFKYTKRDCAVCIKAF